MKKFFAIIMSALMLFSFTLTACEKEDASKHACESKCSVCQLCLDEDCADSACADKCQGHTSASHACESKCPTCGKCEDESCKETACADKCLGHTPPPTTHTCESVCPICGNCMDATCAEDECEEKCEGHGQAELTAAQFVANTSNYLTDANEGISAAAAALGSSVELSYVEPFFPMPTTRLTRSSGVKMKSARTYNAGNSIVLLSDTKDEMMMCAKCGEVEVTVEKKYCDTCKEGMGGQTTPKNYSTGDTLEQYIIFNSVARKIQLIVGATEYYTEYDFAFPNENELALIGTIKFEGEFTKLLKEIEDYELNEDGFYVIEELRYADGTWNPEIGTFDKDLGGQTLIGKAVRGFKLDGNTLITSTYYVSYDYMNNNEEHISEEVYVEYTMDGNNFYYEKYKMEEGQKVVVDMFDIIKEEPNENTLGDVYYVQMMLNGELEITGEPAVYFEEAMDIAEQWQRYVNEKMGTGYHTEVPTKVYLNGRIQKVDNNVMYDMYYFRDYDYAVAGYESTCQLQTQIDEYWDGNYVYEYVRGNSAPLPENWKNGFDINLGVNLENMIEESLYGKYAETLVYRASGNIQTPHEGAKYYPFALKEYSATLDIHDSYQIIASDADDAVWNYSSSNEDVATVSYGYVQTGDVEGEAIITVQRNNLVRYFHVYVRNRIFYDGPEEMIIRLGTLKHAVFGAYSHQGELLEFYSDDEEIVAIGEDGWITAKKEGATAVWARTPDGERAEKLIVYVMPSLDMTRLVEADSEIIGDSISESMHLEGLGNIAITYDTVLNANEEYVMHFDNLDVRVDEYNRYQLCRIFVNGEAFNDDVAMDSYYENENVVWNARSVTFKEAGTYKFEFYYDHQGGYYKYMIPGEPGEYIELQGNINYKEFVLLEINVTVDKQLTYRYDQNTNTFFVKDYEGLLAWYDTLQIDKSANLTLEADIVMPTENFLFDLNGDGINESNWGLDTKNYEGTIDGDGYYIRGLIMNGGAPIDNVSYVAFILSTKNATIQNLNFAEGSLSGINVGGIVGYLNKGYVLNCTNANSLTGEYYTAGIVCYVYNEGAILGCVNFGQIVSSNDYASGIVGYNNNDYRLNIYVVGCMNYGYVAGQYTAGVSDRSWNWRLYGCFTMGPGNGWDLVHNGTNTVSYAGCVRLKDGQFELMERIFMGPYVEPTVLTGLDMVIEELNDGIRQYNEIATVKYNYRYVLNTDPETSEEYPLILQEVTDAQS